MIDRCPLGGRKEKNKNCVAGTMTVEKEVKEIDEKLKNITTWTRHFMCVGKLSVKKITREFQMIYELIHKSHELILHLILH